MNEEELKSRSSAGSRPIYSAWHAMKLRCLKKSHKNYPRYGGRGIKICPEWMDFDNFAKWALENGFQHGLQIDRIDNDGNYEPRNCKFVTCAQNNQNSSNAKVTMEKAKVIRELYDSGNTVEMIESVVEITRANIYRIISNEAWIEKGVFYKKKKLKKLTDSQKKEAVNLYKNGHTIKSLAEKFEVNKSTMHYIINNN